MRHLLRTEILRGVRDPKRRLLQWSNHFVAVGCHVPHSPAEACRPGGKVQARERAADLRKD